MKTCAKAALFYLLERLRLALDDPAEVSRVKVMVVDEAWRYLKDPAVLNYLAEAAKTWRKSNAALVMATQSVIDVTGTAGAEALLESMPTKIFLANPDLPRRRRQDLPAQRGRVPPGPLPDSQKGDVSAAAHQRRRRAPRSRSGELLALYVLTPGFGGPG